MSQSQQHNKNMFIFPENLKFECTTCGECCNRDWQVYIGPKTYFGLKDTEIYKELQKKYNGEELFHLDLENRECTIRKFDGKCPMIQDDNLCAIHVKMGIEEKPVPCRYFPYIMAPTPEGIYVGFSFNCEGVSHTKEKQEYDEDMNQYLRQILEDSSESEFGFGEIPIFNEVVTDWEGYKTLEEYVYTCLNETKNISEKLWKALMTSMMLIYDCRKNQRKNVSSEVISEYLRQPFKPPFERDKDYQYQEFSYAMFLVTLLETAETSQRQETLEALLNGGVINSKTFRQKINIEHLMEYFDNQEPNDESPELLRYFKHLVWRKEILKSSGIVSGLGMLNLTKTLFDWYLYTSAFVNKADKPGVGDFKLAMREVEEAIKHDTNHLMKKYAGDFAKSLADQVTLFMAT
jgi:Fe-S-cluster containining protein